MVRFREAKKTLFRNKLRESGGYFELTIPKHVVERENLKKGDNVRWVVDSVEEDGS